VKVGSFPVFNVADSCVTVGATLLIVRGLFPPHVETTSDTAPGSAPDTAGEG